MINPAVQEARARAEGVTVFTVHVGMDGDKWVGQCQEVDVQVTMPDHPTMREAIRWALIVVLDKHVEPASLKFIYT